MTMKDIEALLRAEIGDYEGNTAEIELGGDIVTLRAKPLTGLDITDIRRRHPDFTVNPSPEGMVDMIIRKARLEDGVTPAFTIKHKPLLQRLRVDKVAKVFADLFGDQMEDQTEEMQEERRKN